MMKYFKGTLLMFLCIASFGFHSAAMGASDSDGVNINVTVDNSMYQIPDTPVIIDSDNITTDSLDLLVEVGNYYATMDLDFVVTITNVNTGDSTTVNFDQAVDGSSQTTLDITGLDPGTEYDFTVRYSLDGMNIFSADSNIHTAVTLLDPPILDSIDDVDSHSATLNVVAEPSFVGDIMDFIVEVTNEETGDTYTIQISQNVTSSSVPLSIDDLDSGTEYSFKVKYAREDSGNFSGYSNEESIVTDSGSPIITDIRDVTTDSVELEVEVGTGFAGETLDFIVHVTDEVTGETFEVDVTREVGSDGRVTFTIDDLDPGTEYSFEVKYAREGSDDFSDYSNEESAVTDIDPPTITDTQNITTDSIDLEVGVDGNFTGDDMDFVVHVTNKSTGETFEIDFTQIVGVNDTVLFRINGLDPGTEYDFKVKYAREGSGEFSDYSSVWTERTDYYGDDDGKKVTICHNGSTISITRDALDVHLNHGDYVGPCTEEGGDGGPHVIPLDPGGTVSGGSTEVPISGNTKDDMREAIIPEERKAPFQTAATIGAIAGAILAFAGSAIPLFAAMPGALSSSIFLKFIELFGIIGRRKEERNWGVVFDSVTHMPLPAVKIILSDESGKELATTYSDKDGRFGFLASEGKYKLNIFKKDYELITTADQDELYGNVFDGGVVEMGEEHVILINIAMKSMVIDWEEYAQKKVRQYKSGFSTFKKYFFFVVYVFGFGSTVIVTYFYPSTFNICVFSLYIVLFIYQIFFKKKKYGSIETDGGTPVPFAVVSLHDDESDEKKRFAVTDAIGRYYLLADNGEYKMKAKGQPISGDSFEKHGEVDVDDGIVRKDIIV